MGNNYRLSYIDDKTKTIQYICQREVESTQMNIKQKNKKTIA
jgi:hypothetical protein